MPLVIDNRDDETCTLPEAIEALGEIGFDPRDEGNRDEAAMWLRRLTNNRSFLSSLLVDQLAGRLADHPVHTIDSGYGPQAIVLSPLRGNARGSMFLRANIWPSERDPCFKASGAASFVYGLPHDHNFSFLTSGYHGPGYRIDYYEYEYDKVVDHPGEPVGLTLVERSALHEGKLMLYRAHRDVHAQLPPEALSVSLNVIHVDPAQMWFDQYGFDLERAEVTRVLSLMRPRRSCAWLWPGKAHKRSITRNGSARITPASGCGWRALKRAQGCWTRQRAMPCGAKRSAAAVASWQLLPRVGARPSSLRGSRPPDDQSRLAG